MTVGDWYNLTNYCLNNGSWLGLKLQQMLFYMRKARKLNTFFFCHSLSWAAINHKYCTGGYRNLSLFSRIILREQDRREPSREK